MKLDIERHVNYTRFGPKSFKDCRKMGNSAIFESVVNHMLPEWHLRALSLKPT